MGEELSVYRASWRICCVKSKRRAIDLFPSSPEDDNFRFSLFGKSAGSLEPLGNTFPSTSSSGLED